MEILITGTHFTPAVATITELKKYNGANITYVGRKSTREGDASQSVESKVIPGLGVKFRPITTGRLQRSLTPYTVLSLLKIPLGFLQALKIILEEKPDVILSFGGYVAVPVVFAGWCLSVPAINHEQTLVSSLSGKICNIFANKIAKSFKNQESDPRIVITGNPMRREILDPNVTGSPDITRFFDKAHREHMPVILVTGGNQGAHIINQAVLKIIDRLTAKYYVIHQTGDSKFQDYDALCEAADRGKHPERYKACKWLDVCDFSYVLHLSTLAVSRAGINTLLEFASVGMPALIIPFPYIYQDEQVTNAQYFAKLGVARVLPQKELSPGRLLSDIDSMISDIIAYKEAFKHYSSTLTKGAASNLALETILLVSPDNQA